MADKILTRDEAIKAMLVGEKVAPVDWMEGSHCRYNPDSNRSPWEYVTIAGRIEEMYELWKRAKWRIIPTPKKRLMTRQEVLGFLAHTPGIVVRQTGEWKPAHTYSFNNGIHTYEYATITPEGVIGEPQKFEIEAK